MDPSGCSPCAQQGYGNGDDLDDAHALCNTGLNTQRGPSENPHELHQDGGVPPPEGHSRAEKKAEIARKNRDNYGWRRVIRNFTPSWFSITMGTGIVSILLHNLPYNGLWLYYISIAIFALNTLLFTLFLLLSILRYAIYPEIWFVMIRHPTQSLFVGTMPMGLATIVNMIVFVCVPAWGGGAVKLAWGLWWIDVVLSLFTCFYLPFVIMSHHQTTLSTMTAAWLLPIVAPIVAAASGGIVAGVLPNPQHALWTIMISYILWGTGVPLAMAVLVIYFQRLTVYKLPPREVIVSVFLPLGPLGQGGFAILQLGKVSMKIFPLTNVLPAAVAAGSQPGGVLYVLGWVLALIMWGFAIVWLSFALASISRSKFPFNMGWWGFTFPLGVLTVSTTAIGEETGSRFFSVLGTILSISVTLLWITVASATIKNLITGRLLFAPCLKDLGNLKGEQGTANTISNNLGEKAV